MLDDVDRGCWVRMGGTTGGHSELRETVAPVTEVSAPSDIHGVGDKSDDVAEALAEISTALSSTLELDDVLDLILDRVARVVPFTTGTIMMLDGEYAEVVRAKGFDSPILGLRLALSEARNLGRVMQTGTPSLVEDTSASPDWVATKETELIQSNMTAAIQADGQVVGAIGVDSEERGVFNPQQLKRLEAFAAQAGNAVRNARLYEQSQDALTAIREQRRLTRVLVDVSTELAGQRDPDVLLDSILERVSRFVSGASVTVLLMEEGIAEVVRTTPGDEALLGSRLVVSETTLRHVLETQRPYMVEDTSTAGSEWVVSEDTASIRSNLTAPIILDNEVIGFLSLSSGEPRAFPEALYEPIETFSNQVGVALNNARAFAEVEAARAAERNQRVLAEALGEVSSALSGSLDLDDVLDLILDRAARVVPYRSGTVLLIEENHAVVLRVRGYDESMLGVQLPLTDLTRRIIDTHEPFVVEDTRQSPDWVLTDEGKDIRSAVVVGIHADGGVIGFISLDSPETGSFTLEQAHRLQAFADQAGNGLRNAKVYEESRDAQALGQRLLKAILPDQIAAELQNNGRVRPRRHDDVAILFADVVGFTHFSDTHRPEEVLEALTEITTRFEEIANYHGLEKLKTIGDSFMAASGLLAPVLNPDLQCVKAGLDMIDACSDLASNWTVRIGVHSGDLVAGVLGTEKFLFDVWGDTVNTASRIESNGIPDAVSVSRRSWDRIAHLCRGRSRGKVALKGKGEMEIFVVEGLR